MSFLTLSSLLLFLLSGIVSHAQPSARWVLVGPRVLAYSDDGYTWTNRPVFPTGAGSGVAYSKERGQWIATGLNSGTSIFSSTDGINWSPLAQPFSGGGNGVAYSKNLSQWVAVGSGANTIAHQTGTGNWTGLGASIFSKGISVAFSESQSRWTAVGEGANTIATSTDGVTWIGLGKAIFPTTATDVAFSAKRSVWVATGVGLTNTLAYSRNGISWTALGTTIFSVQGNGVAYSATQDLWVAVGCCSNLLGTSRDGITWTGFSTNALGPANGPPSINTVAFSDAQNQWVIAGAGDQGSIAVSQDGANYVRVFGSLSVAFPASRVAVADFAAAPPTTPPAGPNSTTGNGNKCFHESTVITYQGVDFSLAQPHPECHVPHVVTTHGVAVTAHCDDDRRVLRLTPGHLIYTARGLVAAADLTTSDTLYGDMEQKRACRVTKVEPEPQPARYFGLNCYTSQVLASGIKASTFEKLHALPSLWFSIAARILGIQRASAIGDAVARLFSQWI